MRRMEPGQTPPLRAAVITTLGFHVTARGRTDTQPPTPSHHRSDDRFNSAIVRPPNSLRSNTPRRHQAKPRSTSLVIKRVSRQPGSPLYGPLGAPCRDGAPRRMHFLVVVVSPSRSRLVPTLSTQYAPSMRTQSELRRWHLCFAAPKATFSGSATVLHGARLPTHTCEPS